MKRRSSPLRMAPRRRPLTAYSADTSIDADVGDHVRTGALRGVHIVHRVARIAQLIFETTLPVLVAALVACGQRLTVNAAVLT